MVVLRAFMLGHPNISALSAHLVLALLSLCTFHREGTVADLGQKQWAVVSAIGEACDLGQIALSQEPYFPCL